MSAPQRILRIAVRFLRSRRFCEALAENLGNQPRKNIQLFIMSGTAIDAHIVRAVGKARWKPLLEAGAPFYEYQPARFHRKFHFRLLSAGSRARAFLATRVSNDDFFVSRTPSKAGS